MRLNRTGILILLRRGWTKVTLCEEFFISRPWLDKLLAGHEMNHPGTTAYINKAIKRLLAKN